MIQYRSDNGIQDYDNAPTPSRPKFSTYFRPISVIDAFHTILLSIDSERRRRRRKRSTRDSEEERRRQEEEEERENLDSDHDNDATTDELNVTQYDFSKIFEEEV